MAKKKRWWDWFQEKPGAARCEWSATCTARSRRAARSGPAGTEIMGHEFHHSEMLMDENVKYAIRLERGTGIKDGWDGMCEGNLVASYTHIHSASFRGFPAEFIRACRSRKE